MNKNRRKVIIVGPIKPYRGGIAHYNWQLMKSLENYCNVEVVSFKRLYPGFLYPGKSDKETEKFEYMPKTRYLIDAYNPLSLGKAAKYIYKSKPDLVLIAWWTLFWQPGLMYIAKHLTKKKIKTIFLCHNIVDHESSYLKKLISSRLLQRHREYIVHSDEQKNTLQQINKSAKILKRIHPVYDEFKESKTEPLKRGELEILFFGFIRPYKGLDVLIDALSLIENKKIYLTIAGEPWSNEEYLDNLTFDENIVLDKQLRYIDDEEMATYFARADVVALPYKSATGSGVVSMAYSYNKPVIATKVGGLIEAVENNKTGWLVEPNNISEMAETIKKITRAKAKAKAGSVSQFKKKNSWDAFSEEIIKFAKIF
jgi:glycosyltransferase involved in cell wall biosynthesis